MSMTDPDRAPLPIDAADWGSELSGTDVSPTASRAHGNTLDLLVDFAQGRLVGLVEEARDNMVSQVRGLKSLASLLSDNIGDALGDRAEPVSRILGSAAGTIDTIADTLAEKSVDELVEDGRALVRAQPAAAVGLAIAIGFLAGRYLKAAQD